jgi:hypothetical protein
MRFTIRDLFLITALVAISLGWLIDHWRAVAREAAWEREFSRALQALSKRGVEKTIPFETPIGTWKVVPDRDVNNKVIKPR